MNEMLQRVIAGWNTYTVRQQTGGASAKFTIHRIGPAHLPPLETFDTWQDAVARCRDMNATEAFRSIMVCTPEMEAAGKEMLDKQDPEKPVISLSAWSGRKWFRRR